MSRHTPKPGSPHNPCNRRNPHNRGPGSQRPSGNLGHRLLVSLCTWLAVATLAAAAAGSVLTIFPATAFRIDRAVPVPGGHGRQTPQVGLASSAGDLRRAPRLTRWSQQRALGQFRQWTEQGLVMPAQATHQVVLA